MSFLNFGKSMDLRLIIGNMNFKERDVLDRGGVDNLSQQGEDHSHYEIVDEFTNNNIDEE